MSYTISIYVITMNIHIFEKKRTTIRTTRATRTTQTNNYHT